MGTKGFRLSKSDAAFSDRIKDLERQLERLRERYLNGWKYRRTWISGTTVKQHKRSGYYAMLPIKRVK